MKINNVDYDVAPQYFIALEQELILECNPPSLYEAMYMLIAVHYVYNVIYHSRAVHFFNFLEEKVLELNTSSKFNANIRVLLLELNCSFMKTKLYVSNGLLFGYFLAL